MCALGPIWKNLFNPKLALFVISLKISEEKILKFCYLFSNLLCYDIYSPNLCDIMLWYLFPKYFHIIQMIIYILTQIFVWLVGFMVC